MILAGLSRNIILPDHIRQLPDMPFRLRACGSLPRVPLLGVVGSRRPSSCALASLPWMVKGAISAGWGIISGGARGIDAAAHRECLRLCGCTAVVLGSGLSQCYPPEHAGLFRAIVASGGCLLSEYEDDAPPRPWRFPRRNRLISALCRALVVVQAAEKSGSLSTARIASEQHGKTVMAIPGATGSADWVGSNRLLRDGALLVTDQEDLEVCLGMLQPSAETNAEHNEGHRSPGEDDFPL